jgi:large subunit ribosomal protein L28
MAKSCEICGKTTMTGNRIVRHGMAKKAGGIGLHTTGITRRKFKPNLHKVRAVVKGRAVRMVACAQCIKAGKVKKAK